MDSFAVIIVPLILIIGFAAITFFSLIPKTVALYSRIHSPHDFSYFILLGTFSVALMLIIYCSIARYLHVFACGIPSLIGWLVQFFLFLITFGVLVPKSYSYFQKWMASGRALYLSIASLFAFLSFIVFSFIVLKTVFTILDLGHVP